MQVVVSAFRRTVTESSAALQGCCSTAFFARITAGLKACATADDGPAKAGDYVPLDVLQCALFDSFLLKRA